MIVLGGVVTALISALGAYLLAARRMSGRIETSAAKELWDESAAMRADMRAQNAELRGQLAEVKAEARACRETIAVLEATIRELRKEINGRSR